MVQGEAISESRMCLDLLPASVSLISSRRNAAHPFNISSFDSGR